MFDPTNAPWLNTPSIGQRSPKVDPDRMADWLRRHGFKPHPSRRDEYLSADCPSCGHGKAWRVMANASTGYMNCYSCGHGRKNVYRWVAEWEGITLTAAVEMLAIDQTPNVDDLWREVKEEIAAEHGGLRLEAPDVAGVHWLDRSGSLPEGWMLDALTATMARGFSFEWLLSKSVGFGRIGRTASRVVLPVFFRGRFVWYQAWDYTKTSDIKYQSPTNVDGIIGRRHIMYQWDLYGGAADLVIAEGVFNAWSAEMAGWPAVATFGKGMSPEQFALLLDSQVQRPVIAYDNDALNNSTRIAMDLRRFKKWATLVKYPSDEDLNDYLKSGRLADVGSLLIHAQAPSAFDIQPKRPALPLLGPGVKK